MKKMILCAMGVLLAACSNPVQQSSVPMDMAAVQEYQQRVASGKTNTQAEHWELDQSDKRPKVVVVERRPRMYPSVHYGYGNKHPRLYSGIGVRLGHYHYY